MPKTILSLALGLVAVAGVAVAVALAAPLLGPADAATGSAASVPVAAGHLVGPQ